MGKPQPNKKPHLEQTTMCRNGDQCIRYDPQTGVRKGCWFAHHRSELRCPAYAKDGHCPKGDLCRAGKHTESLSCRPKLSTEAPVSSEGERPFMDTLPFVRTLDKHQLPAFLRQYIASNREEAVLRQGAKKTSTHLSQYYSTKGSDRKFNEFARRFWTLAKGMAYLRRSLELELCQQLSDIRRYDMSDVEISESREANDKSRRRLYAVYCDGLAEKRPSVLTGDRIFVTDNSNSQRHVGFVHVVDLDRVWVCFNQRFFKPSATTTFTVEFTIPRTTFNRQFTALKEADTLLTSDEVYADPGVTYDDFDEDGVLNDAQLACVEKIVGHEKEDNRLGLTLIHGPPGTGKTTTVVAALLALLKEGHRVLVCCPSNHAADLVVERVGKKFPKAPMLRVYGLSHTGGAREKTVAPYCADPPEYANKAMVAKLVVTTIMSAGLLHQLGIDAIPFDFIVVDEAGQATEAELAVPLLFASREHGTHVTLAGDHKQLGPVLRSRVAEDFGFGRSTLERLMHEGSLSDHSVQLVENYRSHPAVMELYNTITYNGSLVACASEESTSAMSGLRQIFPDTDSPVVFRHVDGLESRERDSPSWKNDAEVAEVVSVLTSVGRLLEEEGRSFNDADVVVLTPYQKQCQVIRKELHTRFMKATRPFVARGRYDPRLPPIRVCSVEQFQGREAKLVILSCVRSRQSEEVDRDLIQSIGFLNQPKRFNVAISRAIAGLVIVGNVGMLQVDSEWRKLIHLIAGCQLDGTAHRIPRQSRVVSAELSASMRQSVVMSAKDVKALRPTKRPGAAVATTHADPFNLDAIATELNNAVTDLNAYPTDGEWGRQDS